MNHVPVMLNEVLSAFDGVELRVFFDGTVGAGGHAKAILQAHPEIETYIACDKDPSALALAAEALAPFKEKVKFVHSDYVNLEQFVPNEVDGFFLI